MCASAVLPPPAKYAAAAEGAARRDGAQEADDGQSLDQSGKPLGDRLVATAPAVRKAAYLELAAILGGESGPPDAEAAAEHADHIPRLLADRAPICHEGALDATIAWLEYVSPEAVVGVAGAVAKALMEKHAPGKYQPKAIAALLSLLRRGGAEPVQSALEAGVRSKAPKTCAAALKASAEALLECGAAAFDAGPVVKQLPTLLQHRDKSVRDAAAALVGAVRHWLGDGIFSQLKGVPEDRLTALREAPLPPTKTHLLQRQGSSAAVVAPPPMAMPPLDLLAKLPRSKGSKEPADAWEKQTLSDKWSERKAAADLVASLLEGQSSLKPADHGLVLGPLKRLYQDANVNVAASAIKATGSLAMVLGPGFRSLAQQAACRLLKRGADKKAVVAEAVRGCLAALSTASCLTLAEAAELALAAMSKSTNTQLRSTAARWLAAAVSAADAEGVGRALDAFDAPLQLLEEDATAEVRALGLEAAAAVGRKLPSEAAVAWVCRMPPKRAERVGKALGEPAGGGAASPGTLKLNLAAVRGTQQGGRRMGLSGGGLKDESTPPRAQRPRREASSNRKDTPLASPPPVVAPVRTPRLARRVAGEAAAGASRATASDASLSAKRQARAPKRFVDAVETAQSEQAAEAELMHALGVLSEGVASFPDAIADVLPPLCAALCVRLRSLLRFQSQDEPMDAACKRSVQLLVDIVGSEQLAGALEAPLIRLLVLELTALDTFYEAHLATALVNVTVARV